jgi:hypothetical protein
MSCRPGPGTTCLLPEQSAKQHKHTSARAPEGQACQVSGHQGCRACCVHAGSGAAQAKGVRDAAAGHAGRCCSEAEAADANALLMGQ